MATPSTKRNQLQRRTFPGMPVGFDQHYTELTDTVNSLLGYNGPIVLNNHIDLQGNTVKNVGPATSPSDVVSQAFAQSNYSAAALRPQLEGSGSQPLQTVRQLNSTFQREQTSSYMNDLYSTPPNANTAEVTFSGGGGSTTITVNPTVVGLADGTNIAIAGRTDTVTNPASVAISTITGAGATATVVTATAHGLKAGEIAYIAGDSADIFNGTWQVSGVTPPDTFTIQGSFGTTAGVGGTVSLGGVYYYVAQKKKLTLTLVGPFDADTPQNRLLANLDGSQIVAVAVVNASGGVPAQSGGGGTPTTGAVNAGSFF